MSNEKNIKSNQFPIIQKKVRCKHDFKIKNGYVYFNYFDEQKKFTGFEFINWLKINHFEYYFEYIIYKWYGYNIIKVYTAPLQKISCKNTKTKEVTILNKFPDILQPKIVGIKPKINNPIRFLEQLEFNSRKKEEENIMKEIEQDNIKYGYVTDDNEELNEGKVFKKSVLALMAFFLSMGIHKTYAQCSRELQAAMKNPNDPKNAKILAGGDEAYKTPAEKRSHAPNFGPSFGNSGGLNVPSSADANQRRGEREEKRAQRAWNKQQQSDFEHLFKPNLNLQGEKLSKDERQAFTDRYNNFIAKNSSFKSDPSRYSAEERYAFLSKVAMEQSAVRYLNVLFGKQNPYENTRMSADELYKLTQDSKINGFDNFTEMYRAGFPGVAFPDNPHKYENKILDYNDYINENWLKKAALAGALATSSLNGSAQQKIDKFTEFKQNENINDDETFAYGLNRVLLMNNDENTYEKILNVYFTKVNRHLRIETEKNTIEMKLLSVTPRKHNKSIKYRH